MKWLILQSAGEHDGSDGWEPNHFPRECFAVADALKRLGNHHNHSCCRISS